MNRRIPLYLAAVCLLVFSFAALAVHFMRAPESFRASTRDWSMPLAYDQGKVSRISAEVETGGVKLGDKITRINGRQLDGNAVWVEEFEKSQGTGVVALTIERQSDGVRPVELELSVPMVRTVKDLSFYARVIVGMLFLYVIPAFCVVVGFWVVFVRIRDALAWMLLFVMLGFSSIALEGYGAGGIVNSYREIFFSTFALSMLLFGIYFPERLRLDEKYPWLKWIVIVPLLVQVLLIGLAIIQPLIGNILSDFLKASNRFFNLTLLPFNLFGIVAFFVALAWKIRSLQSPDARRRLKLMVYGTLLGVLPTVAVLIIGLVSGRQGSFFDRAPWLLALLALFMLLVFPLTMGYVIIVRRAMDVSVVVRQGIQYALARNGARVLQLLLLLLVVFGVITIFRSGNEFSVASQIGFVASGFALIPLIDYIAKNLRTWIDRRFFREAYDADRILSELSDEVRTMVETKPLLEKVSATISESLHVPQIALLLKEHESFKPAFALGYDVEPEVSFEATGKTIERLRETDSLTVYQDDESFVADENGDAERAKLRALNSQLLLPLGVKDKFAGIISLSAKRSEEPFSPNDLRLLRSVAFQTGLALENSRLTEAIAREAAQKERLNRELEIAREVQERLFPQELPTIAGLAYTGACRPALGVGGDYYDFLELPGANFGIAIGDVSGKGIGASLMMASLQASLRGQAIHCGSDLAGLMKHVNTLVYEASTSNRYATFFYGQFDIKTRKLIYVNAGHNPPILLRKNGDILRLEDGGPVVGMLPTMFVNYTQGEIQLETGDLLVGNTDGISEAMNPLDEEWGEDEMLEEIKKVCEKPPVEILTHIVASADRFADGAKQHDDMTMIIVKVI